MTEAPGELLYGPFPEARVISLAQTTELKRDGFTGHVHVGNEEGQPFSAIWVDVHGESPPKEMLTATRNYVVVEGGGTFTLNGKVHRVKRGDLITIPPGNIYAYEGQNMTLFEFNTPPSTPGSYRPVETK